MPYPLVFAACQHVIISQDENNPTLISLLSEIGGTVDVTEPPPKKGLINAPLRWSVFTMWGKEPADGDKEFEQTIRFVSPTGKNHFGKSIEVMPVQFKGRTHRINLTVMTLPVGQNGDWTLQLFVREKGAADWPTDPIRIYPIHLSFTVEVKAETETAAPSE
jgi:hypothetical protein